MWTSAMTEHSQWYTVHVGHSQTPSWVFRAHACMRWALVCTAVLAPMAHRGSPAPSGPTTGRHKHKHTHRHERTNTHVYMLVSKTQAHVYTLVSKITAKQTKSKVHHWWHCCSSYWHWNSSKDNTKGQLCFWNWYDWQSIGLHTKEAIG